MPTNKKQHFLPQHYLRQFRIEGTKQIATVRLDPLTVVPRAAINAQCQQDYFYRDDGELDQLLSQSEHDLAPVIVNVTRAKEFNDEELVALRLFAVFLYVRNRKTTEYTKLLLRRIAYQIVKNGIERGDLSPCPDPDGWREDMMDFSGVAGFLMKSIAIQCWLEMQTLGCKLLEATSENQFITSDNPVVMMNQLFTSSEQHRSYDGFGRSGFQLLLPLSPKLCIFFYDPLIYKVGERKRQLIQLTGSEVELVNALQVQSAEKCIYFHDPNHSPKVWRDVYKYLKLRTPLQDSLRELPGRNSDEILFHVNQPSIRVPKAWSFCAFRKKGKIGEMNLRNPQWSSLISQVCDDMAAHPGRDVFSSMKMILGEPFPECGFLD